MNRSSLGNRTFNSVNAHPLIKSQSVRMMNTFSPLTKPPNNAPPEYIYNNYHNRPINQSTPYKPMYKPGEFIVSSNENERNTMQKRLIDRELMLKDSESVIDDIELYGLIATNELLAVDRAQQRLGKIDITQDINYFAARIDQQSRKACDGIIKDCQDLGDEINNIHDTIYNHLDRNDITIKNVDNKHNDLITNFEKMKTNINKGIANSVRRMDDNAEKVRQIAECIKSLDVQVVKEDVLKCQVDWKRRKEMQKESYALQKMVNEYYNPELEEINKKNSELTKQVLMMNNARKKTKKRQIELNRSREKRKYELMRLIEYVKMKVKHLERVEQLVNERKEIMRKQYEDMVKNRKENNNNNNNTHLVSESEIQEQKKETHNSYSEEEIEFEEM